jgi:hypothetical protein
MASVDYGWAQASVRVLCELRAKNIALCLSAEPVDRMYVVLAIRGWEHRKHDVSFERLAHDIARIPRRTLLSELWGKDLGSLKLLARCSAREWSRTVIDQLADALATQNSRAFLARQPKISAKTVKLLLQAKQRPCSPARLEAYGHLGSTFVDYLLLGLKHRRPDLADDLAIAAIKGVRERYQLVERVHALLLDVSLPEPPWPGRSWISPLQTLRAVKQTGQLFANCLIDPDYGLRALAGGIALYVASVEQASYCICIKRDRVLESWRVDEIKGVGNRKPGPRHRRIITAELLTAGFPAIESGLPLWFD